MSVLADRGTKLVVQGITGRDGAFHAKQMLEYGTRVVAGVTPGKGGTEVHGVPVFDSVEEAVQETKANASVIYVPARFAADAIYEAADAGVGLIVCITEGIPVSDAMGAYHYVATKRALNGNGKPRLVGPNCPGLISPGAAKVGIVPGHICRPGPIGIVSRSGTLTYEVVHQLTVAGLGQSTCLGIGGDPVIGTTFVDALDLFESDAQTQAVVLIGEIGGSDEEEAAQFIKRRMRKPVVAFVAGQTAPPGKRMGHAGAIISGGSGTAAEKMAAFQAAGVPVARIPSEIPALIAEALERRRKYGNARKTTKKATKKTATKARKPLKSKARSKSARKPAKSRARTKTVRKAAKTKGRKAASAKRTSKRSARPRSNIRRASKPTSSRKRAAATTRGRAKARRRS